MAQASAIKSNDRFPGEDDKLPTHPKLVLVVILIIKIVVVGKNLTGCMKSTTATTNRLNSKSAQGVLN